MHWSKPFFWFFSSELKVTDRSLLLPQKVILHPHILLKYKLSRSLNHQRRPQPFYWRRYWAGFLRWSKKELGFGQHPTAESIADRLAMVNYEAHGKMFQMKASQNGEWMNFIVFFPGIKEEDLTTPPFLKSRNIWWGKSIYRDWMVKESEMVGSREGTAIWRAGLTLAGD